MRYDILFMAQVNHMLFMAQVNHAFYGATKHRTGSKFAEKEFRTG